ncbi:glycoside hydrolase family 2 TIM barrel-domain containing protein [Croceivirga sp. JEA036]|uniref:glycoside hydrolase family 2 TIM barrel-domain containing protein n=1 Tax=Croceivirga sp. JEA036 TaxID=2721162 RepID=UPI001438C8BB|nr:glycoside hydrolase family 2 TIM barrel-domain containing protein [Croceivirga sp. JEA036]NJB36066.1 glycoside hydrolase family 2 protein [Croceivirga sp. JEA036]
MTKTFIALMLLALVQIGCKTSSQDTLRDFGSIDFNKSWEFKLQENDTITPTFFTNQDWRSLNLPHDWSVEFPFDSIQGEGATGYLLGGIGWYKKSFDRKTNPETNTYILFDGVYNNSEVWLNEMSLGKHPYGYSPFFYNITDHLKNGANTVKVKVDHSRYADSRWYTGSGIYRNVKLITKHKLHIPIWGTFITTPKITEDNALIQNQITLKNDFKDAQQFDVIFTVLNENGDTVTSTRQKESLEGLTEKSITLKNSITSPHLWDIDNPYRYTAITQIVKEEKLVDENKTPFGIRTIKFDVDHGFFLNGKNHKIKGVCLHHDGGLVGAAVPKAVWRRRLQHLKDAGTNAIRAAHNPPSEEFLDLCDEMGFLVQNEFFDEWDNPKDKRLNMHERSEDYITRGYTEHFQDWAEIDLKTTMLRDRNHPSIIQWSIGNEIEWTYPRYAHATGFFNMDWSGNYFWSEPPIPPSEIKERYDESEKGKYVLAETAAKLSRWTKEMDTTRYVTANCILPSASHLTGYADALDVIGYSYRRVLYDYGHTNYPDIPIMGTENLVQWHEWKAIQERPFISGTFLWTGIDYMGESNKKWPQKATQSGMLDVAGFKKPSYHMMKTLWNEKPHIFIGTQTSEKSQYKVNPDGSIVEKKPGQWQKALWQWHDVNTHWNYPVNTTTIVELYSNCQKIELFLNDTSLGKKQLSDFEDRIFKWEVPFSAGTLKAIGYSQEGRKLTEQTLHTAGKMEAIELSIDTQTLVADGYDVAHIVAQLVDGNNNPIRHTDGVITFTLPEELKLLGVDNGSATSTQPYQSNTVTTNLGRCLLLVQSTETKGDFTIEATTSNGLKASIPINVN